MQVFLTSKSILDSANVLDTSRCNKQISECNQIYLAATGQSKGWANHCVTRLWQNDLISLMAFAWACYYKRIRAGGHPIEPVHDFGRQASAAWLGLDDRLPAPYFANLKWWTDAMRSHLLAKALEHYGTIWPNHQIRSGYYAINKDGDWALYSAHKGDERLL